MNQNKLISDLKNPGLIPFDANLAHYKPKSDNPVGNVSAVMYVICSYRYKGKTHSTLTHQESIVHID